MAADKAARVYCARDCIYHPAMPASNARVICFATQLSKMRLSIREEKWIASVGAAETEGGKKERISIARPYTFGCLVNPHRPYIQPIRLWNVAQCRSRKIAEEVYNRYFKSRPLLLDVYWTGLSRSYVRGETESGLVWNSKIVEYVSRRLKAKLVFA